MPYEGLDLFHGLVELVGLEALGDIFHGRGVLGEDPPVGDPQLGHLLGNALEEPSDELSDVEDLVAQLPSADHVLLPEGVVDTERAGGCVVPQRVGSVVLQDRDRVDDVPDGRVHGGPVGGHDEPVDHDVLPGDRVLDLLGPQDGVERPGPDDVVGLRPEGHGPQLLVELLVPSPEGVVQRGSGGVHPCVEDIGASDQLSAALRALLHGRGVEGGVHVALLLGGAYGVAALGALPYGDGGGEDPLPAQDPVPLQGVGPVLEPDLHELGEPVDLRGPLEYDVLEIGGLQEPLGDLQVLDGRVAPPADGDLLGVVLLLDQDALVLEVLDGRFPGLEDGHAGVLPGELGHAAALVDALLHLEVVLHDPLEVVLVPDGADHDGPGPVVHLDLGVGDDLDPLPEEGSDELLPDQVLLLLVVRVDGDGFACAQQLGPGGGDHDVAGAVRQCELDEVELVDVVPVLHLGVGQGGHAAGAPVNGEVGLVDQAAVEQVHEGQLGDPPVVGGVGLVVDAGVHALSQDLEVVRHLLDEAVGVLLAEPPVLLPGGVQLGDAVLLLHFDLDRGPVDVEAEGEEHVVPAHPLVTGGEVNKGVSRGVAQVKGAGGVPRRVVDAEDRLVGSGVEAVDGFVLPHLLPAFLNG